MNRFVILAEYVYELLIFHNPITDAFHNDLTRTWQLSILLYGIDTPLSSVDIN